MIARKIGPVEAFRFLTRVVLFGVIAIAFGYFNHTIAQQPVITLAQFDSWIFSRMQNEHGARTTLASRIDFEVERIERIASLTEEQKAKIRLAGAGDVKRFFDEVRIARQKFIELGDVPGNQINEAYQLASPLAQRLNLGLFDDDSLLKKVSRTAPDSDQAEIIRKRDLRRQALQKESAIKSYIAVLGRAIPLTATQRARLVEMMDESIEIKTFKSPYISQLLTYRMSQVPKEKFRSILDENQWKAMKNTLDQANALRPFLIQQGLIDDE